ncbi:MAG: hypothetical protein M1832_003083 [Thelocarpon impressellum]|nr:MAG: hypothetical protein M1832_003083 [Thelocarpon impressellum]
MATPRLTFLYPHLFRPARRRDAINGPRAATSLLGDTAGFHSARKWNQQAFAPRHGTAIEPQPPQKPVEGGDGKVEDKAAIAGKGDTTVPGAARASDQAKDDAPAANATSSADKVDDGKRPDSSIVQKSESDNAPTPPEPRPLETVLHMDPPSSFSGRQQKPPHLQAPPYVHHFDTYTLVRDLEKGGFTQEQSVTAMKAVRGLLARNLDVAKEGLVSKSDVENETYLFRAACSELRTEIQNKRKSAADKMRTERNQLQHEVDILNQKMTQESLTLKDELKGMFDDRKMAVRMEQRGMESSIQELNYRITVSLNSDMKSEVEGLRWVLTRRAAMAVVIMAFLILGSLRYTSYQMHVQDIAQRKTSPSSKESRDASTGTDEGRNKGVGSDGILPAEVLGGG